MADKPQITQKDISSEVTPDGNPIQQTAAPVQVKESTPEPKETQPAEQPKDDKVVDFTAFLDAKAVVEPQIKAEAKPEIKPADIQAQSQQPKVSVDPNARDYTGLDEQDAPLFKNMSNAAFNRLKPLYIDYQKKVKELNDTQQRLTDAQKGITKIPDSYYEHPQAFILTPEFSSAANKVQQAQKIFDHWQGELQKIREGATEFTYIEGIDQNGQLIQKKLPADARAETSVLTYLNFAQNQLMNQQAELQAVAKSHQSKSQEINTWANNYAKQAFPYYDKPEAAAQKQELDALVGQFPAAFKNNPLMPILVRSLQTNRNLLSIVGEIQKGSTTNSNGSSRLSEDQRRSGPTDGGTGAGSSGTVEVTMDDFERAKL